MTFKVLSALLCDDVRIENNNKQILIGVYGHEVLFGTKPAVLPCHIVLTIEVNGPTNLEIEFSGGPRTRVHKAAIPADVPQANLDFGVQLVALKERKLRVRVREQGETWMMVREWGLSFAPGAIELPAAHKAEIDRLLADEAAQELETPIEVRRR